MAQTRLYFTAHKTVTDLVFPALETEFEEDGSPIAIVELDEDSGLHEISLYVDGDPTGHHVRLSQVLDGHALLSPVAAEELPDIDWVSHSLEGLKPVRAARFFVHGSHDRDQRSDDDIAIEIDAGQAFGTGHHGTTAGCLEMIDEVVMRERPKNALDLGAGSAVLAIAIAKLAKIPVLATDIDPIATTVAEENLALNDVSDLVAAETATGFDHPVFRTHGPFDLIIANILANPLIELAPQMKEHVAENGSLILSGILDRQGDAVIEAYAAQGFRHIKTIPLEGWVTLHLKP